MRFGTVFITAAALVASWDVAFSATDTTLSKMSSEQPMEVRHLRADEEERINFNLWGKTTDDMLAGWKQLDDELKAAAATKVTEQIKANEMVRKIDTNKWTPDQIADELGIAAKRATMSKKQLKEDGGYQLWILYSKRYAKVMKKAKTALATLP